MKNLNVSFRKAAKADLDPAFDIILRAKAEMNRQNIHQWDEKYPSRQLVKSDIEKGNLHIGMIGSDIACIYVTNSEYDKQYLNGSWQFPNQSFRVIHRLCVDPKFQNKGVGTITVKHIEAELSRDDIKTVRLDVFSQNPFALRMYEKLGYIKVGCANWRNSLFYLMEKKL